MHTVDVAFFDDAAGWRQWLEEHHQRGTELWVGLCKKRSGRPSVSWSEAVDEALCFGWVDGIRRGIDPSCYAVRFVPRTANSTWSCGNVARAEELIALGRMRPAGLLALEGRARTRSATYWFEQQDNPTLDPAEERRLQAVPDAWAYFCSKPPSYRNAAIWWVVSAKHDETRARRMVALIECSAAGRTVPPLSRRHAATGRVPG